MGWASDAFNSDMRRAMSGSRSKGYKYTGEYGYAPTNKQNNSWENDYIRKPKRTYKIKVKSTGELECPKCGGVLSLKEGKHGKFYGCSNFPKLCKFSCGKDAIKINGEISNTKEECPEVLKMILNYYDLKFGDEIRFEKSDMASFKYLIKRNGIRGTGVMNHGEDCTLKILKRLIYDENFNIYKEE